ncbi:PLAC8-domain-containing protein [Penicillium crustosum]|uniref:PLAC8-domain-containing protein n=1 Tax=Penicillium crustosum TaxID=36656 RepID=UPI00239C4F70|nr:PLAC8-domain-containing protein [Penicillium crustosum]KAJ5401280.1 PLAC8-domain-containing protein [Penicillium crustosum]
MDMILRKAENGTILYLTAVLLARFCAIWTVLSLGCVQWIMQTITRGEMREKYGIEGSCCGDCCVSVWCGCCALVQEEKEMELRTRPQLSGYQNPGQMSYP